MPATILGVDVSNYQGPAIHWPTVYGSGYRFAIVRSSEGTFSQDPDFPINWPGLKAAGMIRLNYHLAHPELSTADDEVAYMAAYVDAHGGWLPGDGFGLDAEFGIGNLLMYMLRFMAQFYALKGFLPMFYSGRWFMDPHGLDGPTAAQLAESGLWLAAYQATEPAPPAPWDFIAVWQSGQGSVAGIPGPVDLDTFYGSEDQLRLYGAHPVAPAPLPAMTNDDYAEVNRLMLIPGGLDPAAVMDYLRTFVAPVLVSARAARLGLVDAPRHPRLLVS